MIAKISRGCVMNVSWLLLFVYQLVILELNEDMIKAFVGDIKRIMGPRSTAQFCISTLLKKYGA